MLSMRRRQIGDVHVRLVAQTCRHVQDELQFNPFLRPEEPALQAYTGKKDPVEVLGALRKRKDNF